MSTPQTENKKYNQLAPLLRLLDEKDAIVTQEHICSSCNVRRVATTGSRYRLDFVRGHWDTTTCTARCGLRAAFAWLCKSEKIKDHVLYHTTVVSRCTRKAMNLPAAAVLRDVLWVTALLSKAYSRMFIH